MNDQVDKVVEYAKSNPVAVGAATVSFIAALSLMSKSQLNRDSHDYDNAILPTMLGNNTDTTMTKDQVASEIADYEKQFGGARENIGAITNEESIEKRKEEYFRMIDRFYNLVTDFYEWGWGQSFHFGPRHHDEPFMDSIKRAEYYLCLRLGMKEFVVENGKKRVMKALDVGCGVGGPMRNMCIHSKCDITGVTLNKYQVKIGNEYCKSHGLDKKCRLVELDFQKIPETFAPETFDVAFEVEATCHSPDRVVTFGGIHKVLKPGGLFCGYEWVMTRKWDPSNADHTRIKEGIEVGNALPTLVKWSFVVECMEKAGFTMLDHFDANENLHAANELPWYETLAGKMSLSGFRMTHLGRLCTHAMCWTLETLMIAPSGTTQVSALLNATAIDLVDGGKAEIFTPSYFFLGQKPLK
jgi:sterol 24-C-methyltransferase